MPSEGRSQRFLSGLFYWQNNLSLQEFDIFECFNQPLVKSPSGQTFLTIHDLRRAKGGLGSLEQLAYKAALTRDMRAADQVLTVSHSMKSEILNFFPDAAVSVIYNGVAAEEFNRVTDDELILFRRKYQLPENFVLAVGHFEKRKNYSRLIDAISLLRARGNAVCLVVIGNDSGELSSMTHRVRKGDLKGLVHFLSGLTDLELRCAYKLCSLFVFPSSYEGFGIPILEAMAAGCPMVLSDIPVFREITENRGVYFSHNDSEVLANSIDYVLSSTSECERQKKYGFERIRDFSFQSIARQLALLYGAAPKT
jgi:glycosyltransferase involved in cell wall biosynthesis